MIALDIRLRPNNPVFEKIESHSGNDNDRPPRLWLVTMGSAEMRAAQYMENDTDRPEWDNEWWCDAPGYFDLVWKQNTWPTEEEAMTQRQHVVQSVMQWVKGGCHGEFRYAQKTPTSQHDTTTITTIPSPSTPPEIHIAESSTPPLPPSTPTEPPPTTATDNTITQIKQVSDHATRSLDGKQTQLYSSCSDIHPYFHPRCPRRFLNLLVWKMTTQRHPFILQVSLWILTYQVKPFLCLVL